MIIINTINIFIYLFTLDLQFPYSIMIFTLLIYFINYCFGDMRPDELFICSDTYFRYDLIVYSLWGKVYILGLLSKILKLFTSSLLITYIEMTIGLLVVAVTSEPRIHCKFIILC